jgi:hypothetical protein
MENEKDKISKYSGILQFIKGLGLKESYKNTTSN